ncbi:hypothetical protein IWZ01DRAFT_483234 [Phyllosticta capitalensis]
MLSTQQLPQQTLPLIFPLLLLACLLAPETEFGTHASDAHVEERRAAWRTGIIHPSRFDEQRFRKIKLTAGSKAERRWVRIELRRVELALFLTPNLFVRLVDCASRNEEGDGEMRSETDGRSVRWLVGWFVGGLVAKSRGTPE